MKVLTVFGTRPEAIKMAPLVHALAKDPHFEAKVCVTAQHREMLDQVLKLFSIVPDYDLNIMKPGQGLTEITCRILEGLKPILESFRPDVVLVHGAGMDRTVWTLQARYLAHHGRNVLALDLPGHGRSGGAPLASIGDIPNARSTRPRPSCVGTLEHRNTSKRASARSRTVGAGSSGSGGRGSDIGAARNCSATVRRVRSGMG